jgi:hypothetical protein
MILIEMNMKSDITSGLRTSINLSLINKMNISAFPVLIYEGSFHRLYQQDHPNGMGHSRVFQWILVDSM